MLALTHLLVPALGHAADRRVDYGADWRSGRARRLFHRTLIIDGAQPADHRVEMAVQLNDLFFSPSATVANPMDRFLGQNELRLVVGVDLKKVAVVDLRLAERERDRGRVAEAPWHRRDREVADLIGAPFLGGFAQRVLTVVSGARDAPLRDSLLALAPAFIQVCACFSEDWPGLCMSRDTVIGIGGTPDACYMWRRQGALDGRKKPSDPMGSL